MFKDILVYLDDADSLPSRLATAAEMAAEHGAHLTGLFVKPYLPSMPRLNNEVMSLAEMIDAYNEAIKRAEEEVHDRFEEVLKTTSLTGEWRFVQGDPGTRVIEHGRYADLIIVSQTRKDDLPAVADLPDTVLFGAGRPVLMTPVAVRKRPRSDRVVVAWNKSREAARAVNDALPLLVRAKEVIVLCVNAPDSIGELPGADIATHLARHNVKVVVQELESGAQGAGFAIRSFSEERGADLIVMGGYGHARIREIILGGVTREMLRNSTVPLFMSH